VDINIISKKEEKERTRKEKRTYKKKWQRGSRERRKQDREKRICTKDVEFIICHNYAI